MDIWDAATFEHLMAGGSFMPAQVASPCVWSPEKRLAGAVLASALVGIRDHHGDPKYRNAIVEDLRWIALDDDAPPFSFVRLCQTFGLEPEWVRDVVRRWMARAPACGARRPDDVAETDSPSRVRRRTSTDACPGRSVRGRRTRTFVTVQTKVQAF